MKPPETVEPGSLFSASARLKAPVFQRFYVWGKKEWAGLVDDIETADSEIGQFLGAVVLKDLGRIAGPTSPNNYLMIDGQQRLTTIYLLFLGLAMHAGRNGLDADSQFICKNYLVESKNPTYAGWPKLVPTLQDRHSFYEILGEALPSVGWNTSADPEEKSPRKSSKLSQQWDRVKKYLVIAVGDGAEEFDGVKFNAVLKTVQDDFKLINITLEPADDANAIFSRLNAKGVPLELADLVRNEVFSKFGAREGDKADKFFNKSWQPFEKRIPDTALSAYFPIYAYIQFKGKVTKAAAFPELQRTWKNKAPLTVLAELERYEPFYSSLSAYRHVDGLSLRLNEQVDRFSRMPRTRVTWPFLIQVLHAASEKKLPEAKALRCLRIVESFLVRRALAGIEPTGLHAVFKVLWERTKGEPSKVLSNITTGTIKSPTDQDLLAILKSVRSDKRVILPFVLREYEGALISKKKYDPITSTKATVEHIMPRHLGSGWSRIVSPKDHERLVGLIGNLVSLSEGQNKSLQDQSWAEKKKRFKGSNFKSTQRLAGKRKWGLDEIEARTKEVADWVIATWKDLPAVR